MSPALVVVLAIAALAPLVAVRLRLPGALLEIVAGIVLGPSVLGLVHSDATVGALSLLGLSFLLFLAGSEVDLRRFRGTLGRRVAMSLAISVLAAACVVGVLLALGGRRSRGDRRGAAGHIAWPRRPGAGRRGRAEQAHRPHRGGRCVGGRGRGGRTAVGRAGRERHSARGPDPVARAAARGAGRHRTGGRGRRALDAAVGVDHAAGRHVRALDPDPEHRLQLDRSIRWLWPRCPRSCSRCCWCGGCLRSRSIGSWAEESSSRWACCRRRRCRSLSRTAIGREMGVLDPAPGAGLVAAGLVSVLVFPAVALALLPRAPVPGGIVRTTGESV